MELPKLGVTSTFRQGYQPIDDDTTHGQETVRSSYYQVSVKPSEASEVTLGATASEFSSEKKGLKNPMVVAALAVTAILVLISMVNFSDNLGVNFSTWGKSPFDNNPSLSIYLDTVKNEYQVFDNNPLIPSAKQKYHVLASGKYLKNVNGNGWHYLEVETLHMDSWVKSNNASLFAMSNTTRQRTIHEEYVRTMKALGYLEGFVTCHEMNAWYMNFYSGLFDGGDPTEEALEFLESNHEWMMTQAEKNYLSNEYWLTVKGLISQLEGIVAGAKDGCPGSEQTRNENAWSTPTHGPGIFLPSLHKRPALIHLLLMNANGDLYQIGEKFDQANAPASTVLQNYPNDDDYAPETDANASENTTTTTVPVESDSSFVKKPKVSRSAFGKKTKFTVQDRMEQIMKEQDSKRTGTMKAKPEFVRRRTLSASEDEDTTRWTRKKYHTTKQRRLSQEKQEKQAKKIAKKQHKRALSITHSDDEFLATHPFPQHQPNLIADRKSLHRHDHCSVLIKLTDNKEDVLFSHNTWDDFQCAAPRMIKHYHYNNFRSTNNNPNNTNTSKVKPWSMFNVLFSSSPGLLSSIDDFFLIKGRGHMAVIETSIDVFNNQLLNLVIPESMLSWTRARLANQLAHSGQSWSDIFSLFHSGTYVNQWMVLDFKKFVSGTNPAPGFLTVLEEVPGYIHYEDVTDVLVNSSYWASFNNPYFDDIARLTGQIQLCKENENNCYDHDPRGLIFKREQSSVQTIDDMKRMIGYNQFQTDPLSQNDSCNAIACRQDLQPNPANRYPFGAIDGKVSSVLTATQSNRPMMYTRLGPSPDNEGGPFCWETFKDGKNHRGFSFFHVQHPACFDFDWEIMPPVEMKPLVTFQNPSSTSSSSSSTDKSTDKSSDKSTDKSSDKSTDKSTDKSSDKSTGKASDKDSKDKDNGHMKADNTLIRLERCPEDSSNEL